jgi:hypothetical protein
MSNGILTPLQLIAGASLLQNQGLQSSPELAASISAYNATGLISAWSSALNAGAPVTGITANTVPAFSDSMPSAYAGLGNIMTDTISDQSYLDAGSGDISKFIQAYNIASGYNQLTNQYINSAVNSQDYLGGTFTSTNAMISGDITTVNLATVAFGQDLINLGTLINLDDLDNLGSPFALIQSIVALTGSIPVLSILLLDQGVSQDIVLNLTDPTLNVSDSVQKIMYNVMTQVTGSDLDQILKVLKVTTPNITTMADLLNPVKLFPNSFQSLTVITANGLRAIYLDSQGTIDSQLAQELPDYVVRSA